MRIDPGSTVPIFAQIVNEIQSAIVAGVFAEGERIPSARDMAQQLKVIPTPSKRPIQNSWNWVLSNQNEASVNSFASEVHVLPCDNRRIPSPI